MDEVDRPVKKILKTVPWIAMVGLAAALINLGVLIYQIWTNTPEESLTFKTVTTVLSVGLMTAAIWAGTHFWIKFRRFR